MEGVGAWGKGCLITCRSWGVTSDSTQQQQSMLHHSGVEGWGAGAPPTPIPNPAAQELVGTLVLLELLDRKQRGGASGYWTAPTLTCRPATGYGPAAPSALHPPGCLSRTPRARCCWGVEPCTAVSAADPLTAEMVRRYAGLYTWLTPNQPLPLGPSLPVATPPPRPGSRWPGTSMMSLSMGVQRESW